MMEAVARKAFFWRSLIDDNNDNNDNTLIIGIYTRCCSLKIYSEIFKNTYLKNI